VTETFFDRIRITYQEFIITGSKETRRQSYLKNVGLKVTILILYSLTEFYLNLHIKNCNVALCLSLSLIMLIFYRVDSWPRYFCFDWRLFEA